MEKDSNNKRGSDDSQADKMEKQSSPTLASVHKFRKSGFTLS